jgi:hypothetical protein
MNTCSTWFDKKNHTIMKSYFSCLLVFSFFLQVSAQNIIFVKHDAAAGLQTGASWADAFLDLQTALSMAQYGDQIWVSSGVYYPTSTADRTLSFQLKSGVQVLGGFNGTENDTTARDPIANPTRLSGNIGNPDINTDNSFHVARGKGLDENTLIDGLIFSDGYSINEFNAASDAYGAGLYLTGSSDLVDSKPKITNCTFEKNEAGWAGGGIFISYIDFEDPFQVENLINPVITNCIFLDNKTHFYGGALHKQGPTLGNDTLKLKNCTFLRNYVFNYDGGAVHFPLAFNSNILIQNCVFEENTSLGGEGGAVFIPVTPPGNITTSIIFDKCIFKKNSAPEGGGFSVDGAIYQYPAVTFNVTVKDCIFEENLAKNNLGSAFLVSLTQNGKINAHIQSSTFIKNKANSYFTTAILGDDDCEITALVENCSFYENTNINGPNIYCAAFSAGGSKFISTRINNCVFAYNGSAIFAGSGDHDQVVTDITNCTFFRNGSQPFGKRWYPSFQQQGAMYFNKMNFRNCVIWEPDINDYYLFYNNYPDIITGFGFSVDYCSFHPLNPFSIPNYSTLLGDSIFIGTYPMFRDTHLLDFRLDKCSWVKNRGSNAAAVGADLLLDLDENPRIQFGRVDLGAYEQQDSCIVSSSNNPSNLSTFNISPNPSTGDIFFNLSSYEGESAQIRLFGHNGQVLHEQNLTIESNNTLTFKGLPTGEYFILLKIGDHFFSNKLLIIR